MKIAHRINLLGLSACLVLGMFACTPSRESDSGSQNDPQEGQFNHDLIRAFELLIAGEFEHPDVVNSKIGPLMTDEHRAAIQSGLQARLPVKNAQMAEQVNIQPYVIPLLRESDYTAGNAFLSKVNLEYMDLSAKLNAKDDPNALREAVLEYPEFAAKVRLVMFYGAPELPELKQRHDIELGRYGRELRVLASTRTNRAYGEAKNRVLMDRGADRDRLRLVEALNMFCNNFEDYPTLESLAADINTSADYELLKDFYPTWSADILNDYHNSTQEWLAKTKWKALPQYKQDAPELAAEWERVNSGIETYLAAKEAQAQALREIAMAAKIQDVAKVQHLLEAIETQKQQARAARYP